ncbi:MAG: hypothetical protein E7172_03725 [Firmicutes bacterium]|nr:hypothetical protein [Bacillota bacterium]
MKRFLSILVVGIIGIILVSPVSADAASIDLKCTKNQKLDADGNFTETCTVTMSGNTTAISTFTAKVQVTEGLVVDNATGTGNWNAEYSNGNLVFTNTTVEGDSSADITFGTFTVKVPKDAKECKIKIQPVSIDLPEVNIEIPVEKPTETGASLPLIILGSGIIIAGAVYVVTRRNTKLYKI